MKLLLDPACGSMHFGLYAFDLFEQIYHEAWDWEQQHGPGSKNDLLAIFVERGLELLHAGGRLGAITSRTGFFLTSYRKWREEVVLGIAHPEVMADL